MEYSNIAGWTTFLLGLGIIIFTLSFSYQMFMGEAEVPQVIKMEIPEAALVSTPTGLPTTPEEMGRMLSEQISGQLKEIIPSASIFKTLNLAVWGIGASILVFGGSKISELGIKLIKK